MNHSLSSQKGFTIIELLVVFSIIVILSGVGFASFVSYSRKQAVHQATANLKSALDQARQDAVSRVRPSTCASGDTLSGYKVDFCTNCETYNYKVTAICGTNTTPHIEKLLPSDITLQSIGCDSLVFSTLNDLVSCTDSSTTFPLSFTISGFADTETLTIDNGGNIKLN